jgi:hypothetical protein
VSRAALTASSSETACFRSTGAPHPDPKG